MTRTTYTVLPTWAKNLYTQTKAAAKKRGHAFDLTPVAYAGLVRDRCALTDIPFDLSPASGARRPFAPSIDRPDSSRGYADDNARIVCVAVNIAMNQWGEDVLYRLAGALVDKHLNNRAFWRRSTGKLPPGVKLAYVSKDGPKYVAVAGHGADRRSVGGVFDTPEAAVEAQRIFPPYFPGPKRPRGRPRQVVDSKENLPQEVGRRDWTRTKNKGHGRV